MDDHEHSPLETDELSEYDIYSKTPPRTKIHRKNRERNMRDRHSSDFTTVVKAKAPISRRNTTSGTFDDIFTRQENSDDEAPKRTNKRHMKLLRGSERDLKLDIARAQAANMSYQSKGDCFMDYPKTPSYQIEGSRRFMSLVARTFPCKKHILKKTVEFKLTDFDLEDFNQDLWNADGFDKKVEFFLIMRSLLMLGEKNDVSDNAKRAMSKEETLWQNELKDLIWLELQAYHADKTPLEEDAYLCQARENVEPLLNDIRNYKFRRHPKKYTSQSSDSGVEEECIGCGSLWCGSCMEAQNDALKDIEKLLKRLEEAESLFPSSNSFAELYPLYRSPEIVGKVNVMCQWYNITKQQRLKLNILGRLMVVLDSKHSDWPCFAVGDDSESPSDSNNSTSSSGSISGEFFTTCDHYNITPFAYVLTHKEAKFSPFRRYIENVLKTKALDKGLNFLEQLHNRILQKTKKTLELPKDPSIFETVKDLSEDELCRYGCWSPEYKSLCLPSYRGMYIFLATIPLEVLNEYLLLRLEQKPTNPSALSIRQLMRELKLGLKKALREREMACSYIDAATSGTRLKTNDFKKKLDKFDDCVKRVFDDYLDYLQRWMLYQEHFPKAMLEHHYGFAMEVCEIYPDLVQKAGEVYACIIGTILGNTAERLIKKIQASVGLLSTDVEIDMKQKLFSICRQLQTIFIEEKETSIKSISFVRTHLRKQFVPKECIDYIKDGITKFQSIIPNCIKKLQTLFDIVQVSDLDDGDKTSLNNRVREIMMRIFQFGFEFFREVNSFSKGQYRPRFVADMDEFAYLWMSFVTDRCDRGRGIRPRWAHQGMEYLLSVVQPVNTALLSNREFEHLKTMIDKCISHLVGTTAPLTPDSGTYSASPRTSLEQMRGRSRGSSPSPRPTYKSQRSGQGQGSGSSSGSTSRKVSVEQSPLADVTDSLCNLNLSQEKLVCIKIEVDPKCHVEKVHEAVSRLEAQLDKKLTEQNLIGKVVEDKAANKNSVMRRLVNFSWQRGIKIGQGRFGKVYTAVNNNTGEMMAVKEIAIQYNDLGTLKNIAEEMKILEGISHKNLIKSYGVEVHKDEMLIFMEYCSEGTLECLVADTEKGLSELLARRYTFQLVSGVSCLHDHGIVHRDIKTANIFLTDGGNRLKIGDFGCAVKIKSNVTTPGELKGFVGTQAYMAPEVFTKNMSEGYGRAADIWSIGCVVVEMVSGLRPWAQFDSNVQIMFKVGMGQSPDPPDDMIDEGLEFLAMCFKHDPKERATTRDLLRHNFISVLPDDRVFSSMV